MIAFMDGDNTKKINKTLALSSFVCVFRFILQVEASDNGLPQRSATARLFVTVIVSESVV